VIEHLERQLNESRSWLQGQRWFGDKGRDLQQVVVEDATELTAEGQRVVLCLIRTQFGDGGSSRYLLPVIGLDHDDIRDAFTETWFRTWFFEGFVEERHFATDHGKWAWKTTSNRPSNLPSMNASASTLLRREQSNSSIIYDDRLIAKVFRKLESGINPDVEISEFFATTSANVASPKLVGSVTFSGDGEELVVAILQQFVHNVGDGWGWLLEQLRAGTSDAIASLRLLGQRTAEMHLALAAGEDDPDFAPEPFTNADLEAMQARLGREVDTTFSGLAQAEADDPSTLESIKLALLGLATSLDPFIGTKRIRVHGDYHLGQVLRTVENNFSIIDYEGEPSRPIAERRKKWPALRDVAGMVRSFDYAAETIARERGAPGSMDEWRDAGTQEFLTGYRTTIGEPNGLYPEDPEGFDLALAALIIEKALYEARYEMGNRPDWLPIPYGALKRLSRVA
jgi:maltokinase